jgi:glucoamylase
LRGVAKHTRFVTKARTRGHRSRRRSATGDSCLRCPGRDPARRPRTQGLTAGACGSGAARRAPTTAGRARVDRAGTRVATGKDPTILNSIAVVAQQLAVDTPNGRFWHRANFDGYGEQLNGEPWNSFPPDSRATRGRAWPIFSGERGGYQLAAGGTASAELAAMPGAASDGGMISEQVWDDQPPSGTPGFPKGERTLSATPLAWSHAQFVRLAWSIDAGRPVEQPTVVACRYVRSCP